MKHYDTSNKYYWDPGLTKSFAQRALIHGNWHLLIKHMMFLISTHALVALFLKTRRWEIYTNVKKKMLTHHLGLQHLVLDICGDITIISFHSAFPRRLSTVEAGACQGPLRTVNQTVLWDYKIKEKHFLLTWKPLSLSYINSYSMDHWFKHWMQRQIKSGILVGCWLWTINCGGKKHLYVQQH